MARLRIETQEAFQARRLALVPGAWVPEFERKFTYTLKARGLRAANTWLLDRTAAIEGVRIPLDATDSDIRALAVARAREVMSLSAVCVGLEDLRQRAGDYCRRWGIEPPEAEYVTRSGKAAGVADRPAIARMTDAIWWRGKLRRIHGRNLEAEAIRLGYVHRFSQCYASNVTVERRAQQQRRNAAMLEGTIARNLDTGEEFKLSELAAKGVSDKRIRRGELMVRMKGCEEIAQGLEHVGLFFTVTCPSRMHPKKTAGKRVFDNPKFDGTTPREAQGYLSKMWQRCRAALGRLGIAPYGFRIAEPHHDGTPHWHLLMFCAADRVKEFCRVFAFYARRENPEEMESKEARRARFDVKVIDWKRGTATGYIAKYVSKNIDGYQVQKDFESGADAVTGSQRVEAWASTWGIRQFQPVGQPPVTVWRELRRMEKGQTETMEAARSAADAANWRRYMEVQGGPGVGREDLPLRVAYTRAGERFNAGAGESYPAPLTRYGEEAPPAVYGVRDTFARVAAVSRFYRWEIRRGSGVSGSAAPAPWSPVNNCTEGGEHGGFSNGERSDFHGAEAAGFIAGHVPGAGPGGDRANFVGDSGHNGANRGEQS